MRRVTTATIDHTTTGRRRHPRRRRGGTPVLVVVALVAATLTAIVAVPGSPVAADGNEATGAPLAARSITAGAVQTCAILPSGAVKCWGGGFVGSLGQDSTTSLGDNPGEMAALAPVNLGAGRAATAIAAGFAHTCAVLDDGTVKCWGLNNSGQLGQGSTANLGDNPGEMAALSAVNLGAGRTATAITAGSDHTCALLDDATVKCWGGNSAGQLGQGSTTTLGDNPGEMAALPAVNLGVGRTATAVAAGTSYTCAVLDDATVKCWGLNSAGQLGQGSTAILGDQPGEMAALAPVNLGAGRTATAITGGSVHTCVVLDNGTVKCWGAGFNGQLGQGSTTTLGDNPGEMAALPAVNVGAGRTATAISAAVNNHTCALLDNGTAKCWGNGGNGRLGQDSTTTLGDNAGEMAALPAINLGAGRTATAITTGDDHTCAVLDNSNVKCWGSGFAGVLGQGSTADLGDSAGEMAALAPISGLGPPPPAPALSVVKTADESSVVAGDTIHLHVTVANTGNVALNDVTIDDPNGPDCEAAAFDLAVGADHTVDCTYVTGAGDVGTYSNTASVTSDEVPTPVVSNQVDVTVTEAPEPGLSLVKSADETTVPIGDTVHLHVTVTNTGNVALNDVTIDDPNGPDCEVAPFDLAVGADRTVDCTHTATLAEFFGGYHNTASVTSDEITTAVVSNTVDVTVTIPAGFGLVAGTVTETGSGDPVAGAVVAVLDTATYSPVAVATANGSGAYLTLAPAGTYFVYVLDPTGGHAAGFSGAPTAVVVPDQGTITADVALVSTRGAIAGTVTDTATSDPVAGVLAMSLDLSKGGRPGAGDVTDNNGAYTVGGLTPGGRWVLFVDLAGTHATEFFDDSPAPSGATTIAVAGAATATADAALTSRAAPGTTAHLEGDVTSTVGGDLEGVTVIALRAADLSIAKSAITDASGHYDIAVDPGDYKLAFYDPSGTHLFEFFDNQPSTNLAGATTVTATAGTPVVTDAALTPTTGTVSGTVTETGTAAPLETILVVAVDNTGAVIAATYTNPDGTYTLTSLPPGDVGVRFMATTGTHTAEFFDDAADLGAATPLTITAGTATNGTDAALTPTGG